jgi:hypothetical protein
MLCIIMCIVYIPINWHAGSSRVKSVLIAIIGTVPCQFIMIVITILFWSELSSVWAASSHKINKVSSMFSVHSKHVLISSLGQTIGNLQFRAGQINY